MSENKSAEVVECFRKVLSGEIDDFNDEGDIELLQKVIEALESMDEAPKYDDPCRLKKQMYCVICDSVAKE